MKAKKAAKVILIVFLISFIFIVISCATAYYVITNGVNLDKNDIISPHANAEIYSVSNLKMDYASSVSEYVPYEKINKNIINAFVSLEDKRFFKHSGIDYYRTIGATVHNIKAGYFREGGSTITQQLAKNTLLSNEKTLPRKIKEAKLSYQIEKTYSKEEILTMYLNAIYFGNGIYGVDKACSRLFHKNPSDITVAEAAMLAGIVKNPSTYSPLVNPEKSTARMKLVLDVMKRESAVTEAEYNEAVEYTYVRPEAEGRYYSYSSAAIEEAAGILGISEKEIITGGYKLYTYQNSALQALSDNAFKSKSYERGASDYCVLIADNQSGGVSAYTASFQNSIYNLKRQPASAIKPLAVYAPALYAGYILPETPVLDEQCDIAGYRPKNYGDSYLGWTDVKNAVAASSNAVAVKLMNETGVDYCHYIASRMGISFGAEDGLSSALGGLQYGVTPMQMTEGYMTLANYGRHKTLSFVREIKDESGKTLYQRGGGSTEAVTEECAYLLTDMLIHTAKNGTARKLAPIPYQIAAKTGTAGIPGSDKNSDAWSMSYTTKNTVCVWYGSVSNTEETLPDAGLTGGGLPTLLASYLYSNMAPAEDFRIPEGITQVDIDEYLVKKEHRLALSGQSTPAQYKKTVLADVKHIPESVSDYFDNVLPKDFTGEISEGKAALRFSAREGFIYKIYKVKDGEGLERALFTAGGAQSFMDEDIHPGFNIYYIEAFTEDGISCGKTERLSLFSFHLFSLFQ